MDNILVPVIVGFVLLTVLSILVFIANRIEKRKKTGEQKFKIAVKEFFAYVNKEYTEHNYPTDLDWIFKNFLEAMPEKYEKIDFVKIFENNWYDEKATREELRKTIGDRRAKQVIEST